MMTLASLLLVASIIYLGHSLRVDQHKSLQPARIKVTKDQPRR